MTLPGLEDLTENGADLEGHEEAVVIKGLDDLLNFDLKTLSSEAGSKFQFCDREVAFEFCCSFVMIVLILANVCLKPTCRTRCHSILSVTSVPARSALSWLGLL